MTGLKQTLKIKNELSSAIMYYVFCRKLLDRFITKLIFKES